MSKTSIAILLAVIISFGGLILILGSSVFGIWLAGDSGIRDVIAEINSEYYQSIEDIRNQIDYDDFVMYGTQSDWQSVLSVYSVLTVTDPEDPSDVVSIDDTKEQLLRDIFWQMNNISWQTEIYEIPDPNPPEIPEENTPDTNPPTEPEEDPSDYTSPSETVDDSQDSTAPTKPEDEILDPRPTLPVRPNRPQPILPSDPDESIIPAMIDNTDTTTSTEIPMIEQIRLMITVSHQTAAEMADFYQFSEEQREYLDELLRPENRRLWNDVIYGISTGGNGDIIAVAATQVGNYNGLPYKNWYGVSPDTDWCAIFVSWCAKEARHLESGVIPQFAWVPTGVEWFKEHGRWKDRNYLPSPGDLIFIDWENDGYEDHVGLVEFVDDTSVHTIEGNRQNSVIRDTFPIGSLQIFGYGCPDYASMEIDMTAGTVSTISTVPD